MRPFRGAYAEPTITVYVIVRYHWFHGRQVLSRDPRTPMCGGRFEWADWPHRGVPDEWTFFNTEADARKVAGRRRVPWWWPHRRFEVKAVRRYLRTGGILWPT